MKTFTRYLTGQTEKDLKEKMVFIGGPRQVGKTTLSTQLKNFSKACYLNWDIAEHRERILRGQWPVGQLWVLDEIHKYRSWRNLLKGLYDQHKTDHNILVTGSARLNVYRYGGDSLQGRYHYLRLHPFSVAELRINSQPEFLNLFTLGGFPEPFLKGTQKGAARWSREYRTRLIQEDIASLERIQDIGNLELLMLRLPQLAGSPLSINAIREDLQVSHKTVSNWLNALERLYAIFRLSPFGAPKIRAVKKEQKHYHFDWTLIEDNSIRFENLVACHLLKWVNYKQDTEGADIDLQYFRGTDGKEIDFVITLKGKPVMAVECKWQYSEISKALKYFKKRFPACEAWQIAATGNEDYLIKNSVRVAPALTFLKRLV